MITTRMTQMPILQLHLTNSIFVDHFDHKILRVDQKAGFEFIDTFAEHLQPLFQVHIVAMVAIQNAKRG